MLFTDKETMNQTPLNFCALDRNIYSSPINQKSKCINIGPKTKKEICLENLSKKIEFTPKVSSVYPNLRTPGSPVKEKKNSDENSYEGLPEGLDEKNFFNSKVNVDLRDFPEFKENESTEIHSNKSIQENFQDENQVEFENSDENSEDLYKKIIKEKGVEIVVDNDYFNKEKHSIYDLKNKRKRRRKIQMKKDICKCNSKGCNKRYCPCFKANRKCSIYCKCKSCLNKKVKIPERNKIYLEITRDNMQQTDETMQRNPFFKK